MRALAVRGVTLAVLAMVSTGCALPFTSSTPDHAGQILFGFGFHRASAHEIDIVHARSAFYPGQTIAWVAYLSGAAGAKKLTVSVRSVRTHKMYASYTVPISDPHFTVLADSMPVRGLRLLDVHWPGVYDLRYSRGDRTLAEGTFELRH